jgi:hypothetical protein
MWTTSCRIGVRASRLRCWPWLLLMSHVMAGFERHGRMSHPHFRRFRGLLCARDYGFPPDGEKFSQRTAQVATDAASRSRKHQQRDQSSHRAFHKHSWSIRQNEPGRRVLRLEGDRRSTLITARNKHFWRSDRVRRERNLLFPRTFLQESPGYRGNRVTWAS